MNYTCDSLFEDDFRIISNSLKSIDVKDFNNLVKDCEETIISGNKIIASGLGKNVPICEKFVGTMLSLGLNANFLHTNTAVHGDMGMIHKGDLIILLTKSGATEESVYLYKLLEKRHCNVWLLSFRKQSIIADICPKKLIIDLQHEGDLWNVVPNHSTTINLIVLQKLAMEICKKMNLQLEENFKPNHPGGAIGALLNHE